MLEGFAFSGYRSFGGEPQRIGPLKKMNIIIGQNNVGKSNILRFLRDYVPDVIRLAQGATGTGRLELGKLDSPTGTSPTGVVVELGVDAERLIAAVREKFSDESDLRYLRSLLTESPLATADGHFWVPYQGASVSMPSETVEMLAEFVPEKYWHRIYGQLRTSDDLDGTALQRAVLTLLVRRAVRAINVTFVPAFRGVGLTGPDVEGFNGADLIERLFKLQNPTLPNLADKDKFASITRFVQEVSGSRDARLEVPHDRESITVHQGGKSLPLSHLGTGIHEVVILAVAATVNTGCVMCIEEPEIHLHPTLQKQLIRYLEAETDNQYFITTHSAHLLDTPDAAVFHVSYDGSNSRVARVSTDAGASHVCADLGYRASDLMQANCIVWVEGPSDRIYLRHWIASVQPDLQEGTHFSIMFYGGRLLSHLSADAEVGDFIELQRLNRYIVMVMDSDRGEKGKRISETKRRIQRELEESKQPGHVWVTAGREVENYIAPDLLAQAIKEVHRNAFKLSPMGRYDRPLTYKIKGSSKEKTADKIRVARRVVEAPSDLTRWGLHSEVRKAVDYIRAANGILSQSSGR